MACSKHGSRSIDAIWNHGSLKLKENLASKLCQHESRLNSDQYGRFVSQNLNLNVFKRSNDQWKASFDKSKKAKELFSDIIKNSPKKEIQTEKSFVLDTQGNPELLKKRNHDDEGENEPKISKKKKKQNKSYLDDL